MAELVSEPIQPCGPADARAMARGEPGLPEAFTWRGDEVRIKAVRETWKKSQRERGVGELYLRRHYYRLAMADGSEWVVYFQRQAPRGASKRASRQRWFLYTRETPPGAQI